MRRPRPARRGSNRNFRMWPYDTLAVLGFRVSSMSAGNLAGPNPQRRRMMLAASLARKTAEKGLDGAWSDRAALARQLEALKAARSSAVHEAIRRPWPKRSGSISLVMTSGASRSISPARACASTAACSSIACWRQGLELGRYDGRITVKSRPGGTPWLPTGDHGLRRMADLMNGTSWVYNGNIRHDLSLRRSFKRQFDVFVEAGK